VQTFAAKLHDPARPRRSIPARLAPSPRWPLRSGPRADAGRPGNRPRGI